MVVNIPKRKITTKKTNKTVLVPIALKNFIMDEIARDKNNGHPDANFSAYMKDAIKEFIIFLDKHVSDKLRYDGVNKIKSVGYLDDKTWIGVNRYVNSFFSTDSTLILVAAFFKAFGVNIINGKKVRETPKKIINQPKRVKKLKGKKITLPKGFELIETEDEIRIVHILRRLD